MTRDDGQEEGRRVKQKRNQQEKCAWLSRRFLKLHQEQGVAFKEIALLTSSRSRNDQILPRLSEYGIPCQN